MSAAIFTFWIAFGLFFISAPQQLLMTESGKGGGELLAGAAVQVAFNFGNAVGSMVGGGMLNLSGMNYHFTALGGRAAGGHRGGAADHILHASRDAHRRAGAYARDHGVSFAGYRLSKLADTSGISLNHRYICEF